jgi:hypothetical protein
MSMPANRAASACVAVVFEDLARLRSARACHVSMHSATCHVCVYVAQCAKLRAALSDSDSSAGSFTGPLLNAKRFDASKALMIIGDKTKKTSKRPALMQVAAAGLWFIILGYAFLNMGKVVSGLKAKAVTWIKRRAPPGTLRLAGRVRLLTALNYCW